jgi:predicted DNA-binding transcriptional regulator AlpA
VGYGDGVTFRAEAEMVATNDGQSEPRQDDKLIPLEAVADLYGIKPVTVWKWVDAKRIPGPVANRHRYTRWSHNEIQDDIARMKEEARKESAA